MKQGSLSEYFQGVAAKRLTEVEANVLTSNQHEFNGVRALREMLGEPEGRVQYPSKMIYLSDDQPDALTEEAVLTWYDARQKAREERGVMREEYRLYFPSTSVSAKFAAGDLLVIALCQDGSLLVIVAQSSSSALQQIEWLFGLKTQADGFELKHEPAFDTEPLGFASRFILESIGQEVGHHDDNHLDEMIALFGTAFPTTLRFSAFSRSKCPQIDSTEEPDVALVTWLEQEEQLFRSFEKHIVSQRLREGFGSSHDRPDVDAFVSYSLSVQNRRKSRAGLTLENHLEHIFKEAGLICTRTARTESHSNPDFLFPSESSYHDPNFSQEKLLMLAVKTTCKDRWRQVLAEADRITRKHLLTLEAPISNRQLGEMRGRGLILVIPAPLQTIYPIEQRAQLCSLRNFMELAKRNQA